MVTVVGNRNNTIQLINLCTINMLSEIVLHHKCLQIATYPKVDFPIFFFAYLVEVFL